MRIVSFIEKAMSSDNKRAVAPMVWQESLSLRADASMDGDGSAPVDLLAAIASGSPAAYGGMVENEGCARLQLDITYLTGADCDGCSVDALTTQTVTVFVGPDRVVELPAGFISQIQASSVDSTGAPLAVTSDQEIAYCSSCVPNCSGPVLVP